MTLRNSTGPVSLPPKKRGIHIPRKPLSRSAPTVSSVSRPLASARAASPEMSECRSLAFSTSEELAALRTAPCTTAMVLYSSAALLRGVAACRADLHRVELFPELDCGRVISIGADRLACTQNQVTARPHQRRFDANVLGEISRDLYVLCQQAEPELGCE